MAQVALQKPSTTIDFGDLSKDYIREILYNNRHDFEQIIESEFRSVLLEEADYGFESDIEQIVDEFVENTNVDTSGDIKQKTFKGNEVTENCEYCPKYERVVSIDDIKRGDSVRFPRLLKLYYHHAIVKQVEPDLKDLRKAKCKLTLIHLQKVGLLIRTAVIEEPKYYDLEEEEVERDMSQSPKTPDEIVKQAEDYVQNDRPEIYKVLGKNCEHLTNIFRHGNQHSAQADKIVNHLKTKCKWLMNIFYRIGRKVMEISGLQSSEAVQRLQILRNQLSDLDDYRHNRKMCIDCHYEKHTEIRISFLFGCLNLGISASEYIDFQKVATGILMTLTLALLPSSVANKHVPYFKPAFGIPKRRVTSSDLIVPGDILTFEYFKLPHEGVVTEILSNLRSEKRIKITVIHYPCPSLFSAYTVKQEDVLLDLRNQDVFVLNFEENEVFAPSEVIQRAKTECGRQNYNFLTYRSCHLSRFCKTGKKEMKVLRKKQVKDINDISPGDVIEYKYMKFDHEAVVVKVELAEPKMQIGIVHYALKGIEHVIIEEKISLDLAQRNVFVHDYQDIEVYSSDDVIQRARSRLGEKKFNAVTNRSSHVAKWCKVKEMLTSCQLSES